MLKLEYNVLTNQFILGIIKKVFVCKILLSYAAIFLQVLGNVFYR